MIFSHGTFQLDWFKNHGFKLQIWVSCKSFPTTPATNAGNLTQICPCVDIWVMRERFKFQVKLRCWNSPNVSASIHVWKFASVRNLEPHTLSPRFENLPELGAWQSNLSARFWMQKRRRVAAKSEMGWEHTNCKKALQRKRIPLSVLVRCP